MVKFLQEIRLLRIEPLELLGPRRRDLRWTMAEQLRLIGPFMLLLWRSSLVIDGELSNGTDRVPLNLFEPTENFSSFPRLTDTSGRTPENELDEMSNSTKLER
ncbi:hypothetical protein V6N13_074277 [Hibiscus sabdariffa]|uniref:Uncharacterized protein n=1 Tax=Hibiscus sabdariffa TaxID=183260 RepID=A0ABR2U854_9ROSI